MSFGNTINGSAAGLRWAEEASIRVLPGSGVVWNPISVNSYNEFGGQYTLTARETINEGRKREKGVQTDFDANAGFVVDFTQDGTQPLMEGFLAARFRRKAEVDTLTNVDGTNDEYEKGSGLDVFAVGDLVFAKGFSEGSNNGLKRVTSAAAGAVGVATSLAAETPAATAALVKVGVQGTAGDIDVDASGGNPALTSTTFDFTTLGLVVGEPVWVGGDGAGTAFSNTTNNGRKRVASIATNRLEFDKSESGAMVTEDTTTETLQLFIGRYLKDETGASIACISYQLERTLGAPNPAQPTEIQAQYLTGSVANQAVVTVAQGAITRSDLTFISAGEEIIDGPTALKTGARPTLDEGQAFNATNNIRGVRLAVVTPGNPTPSPLFAFAQDMTITMNNNVQPAKAIGTLGAFSMTLGTFAVSVSMTPYLSTLSSVQSVIDNDDITLDFMFISNNAGIVFDFPLLALGDGRPDVTPNQPATIPLTMEAATGKSVSEDLDHTVSLSFFDYLPDAAAV